MTLKIASTIPCNEYVALELPERYLWLAVVERALKDYCFFFDRLTNADQGDRVMQSTTNFRRSKRGYNLNKARSEYQRLSWFMFDTTLTPFNLEYICTQLYDDGNGVAEGFRMEAMRLLNRHILDSMAEAMFPHLVIYIKTMTPELINAGEPRDPDVFKTKRYRLFNSDS